ncbi:hypothetical protein [Streptomyces sp. CB01881]|uniref:hypothetical protein n=1 Tax=Streptomyces sp. CB01881 TaxID=2078691 RepID=UPI000CDCB73C|nr:hypothetical protein [Streptomyces sp. CB01881]AUY51407.1 hypothetical protein C2142_23520 [Streptomyces sp. CB01881]TYC74797.1 hypothetical protein EH183_23505 [Streptomyces sp. CB01881]
MTELETEAERLRHHRVEAEEATEALETAIKVAGLPPLVSLSPVYAASGLPDGAHVHIGGCSATTALALADVLTEYARLTGRLIDGGSQRLMVRVLADHGVMPALPSDGLYVVARELGA